MPIFSRTTNLKPKELKSLTEQVPMSTKLKNLDVELLSKDLSNDILRYSGSADFNKKQTNIAYA